MHLMGSGRLLLFLLKPALLNGCNLAGGSLALNLDLLVLVGGQLASKIGLFRGRRGLGNCEFLNVGLGVAGLDGGRLVGTQLTEVQVLNGVG